MPSGYEHARRSTTSVRPVSRHQVLNQLIDMQLVPHYSTPKLCTVWRVFFVYHTWNRARVWTTVTDLVIYLQVADPVLRRLQTSNLALYHYLMRTQGISPMVLKQLVTVCRTRPPRAGIRLLEVDQRWRTVRLYGVHRSRLHHHFATSRPFSARAARPVPPLSPLPGPTTASLSQQTPWLAATCRHSHFGRRRLRSCTRNS